MLSKLKSVLFWSIISAAFIGPGTVTVAAKAGATYGVSLLWALLFSVIATAVLQEAAARLTISSGLTMGEAIAQRFSQRSKVGPLLFFAIFIGCAAYEAGNILGAVSGVSLIFHANAKLVTVLIVGASFVVLQYANMKKITNIMTVVVAMMGFSFIWGASQTDLNMVDIAVSSFRPSIPSGSSLLIIGLIGTTVVPYNLFLGSGISRGQNIGYMRFGLIGSVFIGGVISASILIVGTTISGGFSFPNLVLALAETAGATSAAMFGLGLFAAGFTSVITAPLAAAITGQSILGQNEKWNEKGVYFRMTWISVLLIGLVFGLLDVKPVPVIILAQALNGLLLPFVAVFLWVLINDFSIIKREDQNGILLNVLTGLIVLVAIFLGVNNVLKALLATFSVNIVPSTYVLVIVSVGVFVLPLLKVLGSRK